MSLGLVDMFHKSMEMRIKIIIRRISETSTIRHVNLSQHIESFYIILEINWFIFFVYFNTVVLTNGHGTFNTIRIGLSDRVKI